MHVTVIHQVPLMRKALYWCVIYTFTGMYSTSCHRRYYLHITDQDNVNNFVYNHTHGRWVSLDLWSRCQSPSSIHYIVCFPCYKNIRLSMLGKMTKRKDLHWITYLIPLATCHSYSKKDMTTTLKTNYYISIRFFCPIFLI